MYGASLHLPVEKNKQTEKKGKKSKLRLLRHWPPGNKNLLIRCDKIFHDYNEKWWKLYNSKHIFFCVSCSFMFSILLIALQFLLWGNIFCKFVCKVFLDFIFSVNWSRTTLVLCTVNKHKVFIHTSNLPARMCHFHRSIYFKLAVIKQLNPIWLHVGRLLPQNTAMPR